MNRSRLLARAATPVAALAGALALAVPASAHVEVESATPQALAVGAAVSFHAEAESTTAGISQVRVALPAGITAGDVTLADAPKGWQLTAVADGYQVAGPALAPGKDAAYTIKVRQLPDARQLVFKSLVTYTDGHVDRWIELPQGGAEPQHPAPVLKLTAAAPGARSLAASGSPSAPASPSQAAAPTQAQAAPSAPASPSASPAGSAAKSSGSGTATVAVVAVLAVAVAGVLIWRRRAARD